MDQKNKKKSSVDQNIKRKRTKSQELQEKVKKQKKVEQKDKKKKEKKQSVELGIFSDEEVKQIPQKKKQISFSKNLIQATDKELSDISDMEIDDLKEEKIEKQEKQEKKEKKYVSDKKQQKDNKEKPDQKNLQQQEKQKKQKNEVNVKNQKKNTDTKEKKQKNKKNEKGILDSSDSDEPKKVKKNDKQITKAQAKQLKKQLEYEETIAQKMGLDNQSQNQKKWNDKGEKSGKFTDEELDTLRHAVCRFGQEQGMDEQSLVKFISDPSYKSQLGAWSKIAQSLPGRSVQSVHNVIKRKYNPNNYKGRWSEDEVKQLLQLVELHGRKWEQISKELDRTALNCRDKYKSIGQQNYDQREKLWSLEEIIKLMKHIEKSVKIKFLDREKMNDFFEKNIKILYEKIEEGVKNVRAKNKDDQSQKHFQILSTFIKYQSIKNVKFDNINWTKISEKLVTKSYTDCRNKWKQQLQACVMRDMGYTEDQDFLLVEGIKNQKVEEENEIDFSLIENGQSEEDNKKRWIILKKRIGFEKVSDRNIEETIRNLKTTFRRNSKPAFSYPKHSEAQRILEESNQVGFNQSKNILLDLYKNDYIDQGGDEESDQ